MTAFFIIFQGTENCVICSNHTASKCGKCKAVFYCSKECQKSDWNLHKVFCSTLPFPITPVEGKYINNFLKIFTHFKISTKKCFLAPTFWKSVIKFMIFHSCKKLSCKNSLIWEQLLFSPDKDKYVLGFYLPVNNSRPQLIRVPLIKVEFTFVWLNSLN